jgi:hypothetical protein
MLRPVNATTTSAREMSFVRLGRRGELVVDGVGLLSVDVDILTLS